MSSPMGNQALFSKQIPAVHCLFNSNIDFVVKVLQKTFLFFLHTSQTFKHVNSFKQRFKGSLNFKVQIPCLNTL
ncbi:CLUMA_CG011634, isoform A [Clunio marinus]|uniref:CLUMA_CG011634, isoform A n=1 Tax=Clunio marinus TaxID=568069 RepID=A0A1J1IDI1_9DIPT|nr:CLUMA_CG011634, isoform A [Clunio marinus]